jgi:regulatory protein
MDLLARREHSRQELLNKLTTKGFEPEEAAEAVAGLEADGLVNDSRFVESFTAYRIRRGQGPMKIGHDLEQRGIPRDMRFDSLNEPDEIWVERATDVLNRKFGGTPASDYKDRARRMRFLYQRGFTSEQARAAVNGAQ